MEQDLKKLKKLIKFCQKEGILEYKTPELSFSLSPTALFPEKETIQDSAASETKEAAFSEEDALFWSSSGLPDQPSEAQQ